MIINFLKFGKAVSPGIPLVMFDWFQTNSLDLVTSNPFGHPGSAMAHCNHEQEGFSYGLFSDFAEKKSIFSKLNA